MEPLHELVHSLESCDVSTLSALSPHPRFRSLYKNNARTHSERQNDRRRERLARQKQKREALLSEKRDSKLSSVSDISEIASIWDADDELMDCAESGDGLRNRRTRPYRNILMLSEWMIEVPDNFEEEWMMLVCPVGKRCAVVSSQGQSRAFARNGFEFMTKFPSQLPGGNRNERGAYKHSAILDCIFCESEKTFFILDVILWNGVSFYGCQTDFRFFWLDSKKEDLAPASVLTSLNKFMFKQVPRSGCTTQQIRSALTDPTFPAGVDGYLFLHNQCCYVAGVTPLAAWLKREMVEELLL